MIDLVYGKESRRKIREAREKELEKPYDYDKGRILSGKSKGIDFKNNVGKFIVTDEFYRTESFFSLCKIFKLMIIVKTVEETGENGIVGIKYIASGPMFNEIEENDWIPYYRFIFKREINKKSYRKQTRVIFLECDKDYYYK